MFCRGCGRSLFGKPKISVDGSFFCYTCAKEEVSAREKGRREEVQQEYQIQKKAYEEARAKSNMDHAAWARKKQEFVGSYGCAIAIVAAIVLSCIIIQNFKGIGFAGVVVSFIVCGLVAKAINDKRNAEFRRIHPEPRFDKPEPRPLAIRPVDHSLCDHDGSTFLKRNYREVILCRDSNTCQICGKRKPKKNLEVHHIIPRAQGGSDDQTNLVTLCKYCHDREDWYGHVRMFPTTIKKSRRSKGRAKLRIDRDERLAKKAEGEFRDLDDCDMKSPASQKDQLETEAKDRAEKEYLELLKKECGD